MKLYGAIDIGSNAARLLICEVYENQGQLYYKKRSLVRVPLRLGEEVFEFGYIPPKKELDILKSMKAYKNLLEVNGVNDYKAVATSAMRDARNGAEIVEKVKREAKIDIEIIDGKIEAKLLYSTHFEELLAPEKSYVYIDVGGGSTEVSIFSDGEIKSMRSFNIGTIRLLKDYVTNEQWQEMRSWIEIHTEGLENIEGIGSGGNINKLYKLNGSRADMRISLRELEKIYNELEEYSYLERITKLGMRGDRADVILPATKIFKKVAKWAKIKEIYVPKFGLSDGIIRMLANDLELSF
jgi:exopolyphosphatase/guanosine-5'-triphosphate,3'-diphosphate pyrophosphatase